MILRHLDKDDRNVVYKEKEPFTTGDKKIDASKAKQILGHEAHVPLEKGIPLTIEWMKKVLR